MLWRSPYTASALNWASQKTLLSTIYMYQLQAHQCYVVLVMNDDDDDDDDDDQLYLITLAYSTMQKHQLVSSRGVS